MEVAFYPETPVSVIEVIQRFVGVHRLEMISVLKRAAVSSSAYRAIVCQIQTTIRQCGQLWQL
jgi:hypothetical protein